MLEFAYLVLVALVSFIIAANNSAGSIGTLYGSRIVSYYKSAIFAGFFIMMGAFLEGWKMAGAIGGGMVAAPLSLQLSIMVLVSTTILLLIFTFLGIPLSASQIMVGSIIGVAVYFAISINTIFVVWVTGAWILNLVASMLLAILVYFILTLASRKRRIFGLSKFYTVSLFVSSGFIAYTLGANTIGLIASLNLSVYSVAISGISAFLGAILFSKRTVATVGRKIISLDPARAFSAQISGSIIVEMFTQIHLPVSITQAIVGGVIGTGLAKGKKELNTKTLKNLAISWLMVPLISFLLTYIMAVFLQL